MTRLFILALLFPLSCMALQVGDTLPDINFDAPGRLTLTDKGGSQYSSWSTQQLRGKKWVIQYIAPRIKIGKQNIHLSDALEAIEAPKKQCRTVSIINLDEAVWGTKSIAKLEMKKGYKRNLECVIIADEQSLGIKQWQLKPKGNATIVIDQSGQVIFLHEGKLTEDQVQHVIKISDN